MTNKTKTSAGKFFGWRNRVYDHDSPEAEPYMTRSWIGRLRYHVFHRGDKDQDLHDHPWPFLTFPLNSYVELVAFCDDELVGNRWPEAVQWDYQFRVVRAFRFHWRPATYKHRVIGLWSGKFWDLNASQVVKHSGNGSNSLVPLHTIGTVRTIVWRGKPCRDWGFLKHRDGRWCWVYWRDYVFNGGKEGLCK